MDEYLEENPLQFPLSRDTYLAEKVIMKQLCRKWTICFLRYESGYCECGWYIPSIRELSKKDVGVIMDISIRSKQEKGDQRVEEITGTAKMAALTDGRKVVLKDDKDIVLSLISNDKVENTFELPYPSGGYGGGSLQLSPSEKYLVFSYFSGESEEAFSLFKIENGGLRFLYDSGYLYGEDANYSFVNDEKILIQTFRTGIWYEENAQTDENGDKYYEFGELNRFDLETYKLDRHIIHVYPTDDWVEEKTDVGTFLFSDINGGQLNIIVPWGKETFHEPLQNILTVRFKETDSYL